ncbi:hypothetical protein AGMMS49975_03570 [Clostridia bacterium]|nr:hypothetical protein AGMMS49975_03570 [Clostridia bacterium]
MSVIAEIIRVEESGDISFGNYSVSDKQKVNDFDVRGDLYKVKTHNEITRLEKNSKLLLETVPGAAIHNFHLREKYVKFLAEGKGDTQLTLELESEQEYKIIVDDVNVGRAKSSHSGKLIFSAELTETPQKIKIEKL